jgi:hypothetical protein
MVVQGEDEGVDDVAGHKGAVLRVALVEGPQHLHSIVMLSFLRVGRREINIPYLAVVVCLQHFESL